MAAKPPSRAAQQYQWWEATFFSQTYHVSWISRKPVPSFSHKLWCFFFIYIYIYMYIYVYIYMYIYIYMCKLHQSAHWLYSACCKVLILKTHHDTPNIRSHKVFVVSLCQQGCVCSLLCPQSFLICTRFRCRSLHRGRGATALRWFFMILAFACFYPFYIWQVATTASRSHIEWLWVTGTALACLSAGQSAETPAAGSSMETIPVVEMSPRRFVTCGKGGS